ncbi:MAG: TetR/AcrR family transcriptional regulator [Pseudonocardia sp.]|nr:TetR/AcrR family transcriptional regulator [Pseudonocardia sp.]
MATPTARMDRRTAVAEMKRSIILEAALRVFERAGLEGASMRAIAQEAGYTAGAIYSHFPGKEHIYAAALSESLDRLRTTTEDAAARADGPPARFVAAGLAFFDFYDTNPRDLDLGFYLFGRGIRPRGLSPELNRELNTQLLAALQPLTDAAVEHGASDSQARVLTADAFAHACGLLLLAHTRRLELFACPARDLLLAHLERLIERGTRER